MKALTLNPMAKAGAILFLLLLQTKPALAHGCSTPAFAAPLSFGAAPGPSVSVATGDFNGDAKAGLVLGHEAAFDGNLYNVSVLLGSGDGTFQSRVSFSMGGQPVESAQSIAVGANRNRRERRQTSINMRRVNQGG